MKKLKKIIALFAIVAMVAAAPEKTEAQVLPNKVTPFVSVYGNLTDTVVGTATKYLYLRGPIKGYQTMVTAAAVLTSFSGTPAGTIICQASVDSLKWYNVAPITADSTYGVRPLSGDQAFRWKLKDFRDIWLRFMVTGGSSTVASIISGKGFY